MMKAIVQMRFRGLNMNIAILAAAMTVLFMSAGCGDDSCQSGQSDCDGLCVNTESNPNHCGACKNACKIGEACTKGKCTLVCQSSLSDCKGSCVNLKTDHSNCGVCGTTCKAGQVCSDGKCALSCQSDLSDCKGTCVNMKTDIGNCGACGTACKAGQVCSDGKCALTCQDSLKDCKGLCINTKTDIANCGACGTACKAGEVCSGGTCALSCQSSLTDCKGTCVNLKSDISNCGACGTTCKSGEVCSSGTCTLSCQSSLTDCKGICVNLKADVTNCGACGTSCKTAEVCSSGSCALSCQTGLNVCKNTCVDLQSNINHCGKCGSACTFGQTCSSGACASSCGNGKVDAGEQCDSTNLGGKTCSNFGYVGGSLACKKNCSLDAGKCFNCKTDELKCDGLSKMNICTKGLWVTQACSDICLKNLFGYAVKCEYSSTLKHDVCLCDGGEFASIKKGSFLMGSPSTEKCREPTSMKESQHLVTLTRPFAMMKKEVSQYHYKTLMGYNPSGNSSCSGCPVESVSWNEAAAYSNALSLKAKLTPCYQCTGSGKSVICKEAASFTGGSFYTCPGFRLPTEAEWEYAYRSGTKTAYYNGAITNCTGADSNAALISWYKQNTMSKPYACGAKKANAWGLYDMAGNVWEWGNDLIAYYDIGTAADWDPWGANSGSYRIIRGGAYTSTPVFLRAAVRIFDQPDAVYTDVGFRCVRTLKP